MGPFSISACWYGLPAFRAGIGVWIVLAGGSAVIPGAVAGLWHWAGWGAIDRDRVVVTLRSDSGANGKASDGQHSCRANPAGTTAVMLMPSVMVATMAAPVSLGRGGGAQGQNCGDAEGGKLFHGSTRVCRLDKPNNALPCASDYLWCVRKC